MFVAFKIPVLSLTLFYISLMSLAFPASSRFAWLNLSPLAMWLLDMAENVNHFVLFAIPVAALFGFAAPGVKRLSSNNG